VESKSLRISAFCTSRRRPRLVPAVPNRQWMRQTEEHFADRCLPLRIANQMGWFVLNDVDVTAVWNGSDSKAGIRILTPAGIDAKHISSHFGYGVLTWTIPYLFRTPPGYNLYVRGPTNAPKDGACALDGVVETDWAAATFTMNWKLTCADVPVSFKAGEPIAMIMPIRRGEIEEFEIATREISSDEAVEREYKAWYESRSRFLHAGASPERNKIPWQKDYFLGRTALGTEFEAHQTNLKIKEVVCETDGGAIPAADEVLAGHIESKYREPRVVAAWFRFLWQRIRAKLKLRS
jgi:Family of unknown function (DUF6065)